MNLQQKIVNARTHCGLTQEELAAQCSVTVRTIQRIESGSTIPRSFTLRSIATALHIPFEELNGSTPHPVINEAKQASGHSFEDERHFLRTLCLSCFSYLLIPYLHFLIPSYLLKKEQVSNASVLRFARGIISGQIYWVIINMTILLLTLGFNLMMAAYQQNTHISYLIVFFALYLANAVIILLNYRKASQFAG